MLDKILSISEKQLITEQEFLINNTHINKKFDIISQNDCHYNFELNYYNKHNIYFIDKFYYPYVFLDNKIFVNLESFTRTINYIYKCSIIKYNTSMPTKFEEFILNNNPLFKQYIIDRLKIKELAIDKIYTNFIFSNNDNFFELQDIKDLFYNIYSLNLINYSSEYNMYYLKANLTKDEFINHLFNNQTKVYSDQVNLSVEYFDNHFDSILKINSKLNIIPNIKSKTIIKYIFDITKIFLNIGNQTFFVPQYLLFEVNNDRV